jgi:hypothetical protein
MTRTGKLWAIACLGFFGWLGLSVMVGHTPFLGAGGD